MTDAAPKLSLRELLIVTGKGGTGKSAVAAALAVASAAAGRRTLLLESDPRESGHRFLGCAPSAGDVVDVRPRLRFQNVRPADAVDRLVAERLPSRFLAKRVLASPIYRHFVSGAPGLEPLAVLGHAAEVLAGRHGGGVERVVLDAPATGHAVSALVAARLVRDAVGGGPVAELAGQVGDLVADAARTGIVVVTLAEEMPVTETLELAERLRREAGREPDLVVVNALYPPPTRRRSDAPARLWRSRYEAQRLEMGRLEGRWTGPRLDLELTVHSEALELTEILSAALSKVVA